MFWGGGTACWASRTAPRQCPPSPFPCLEDGEWFHAGTLLRPRYCRACWGSCLAPDSLPACQCRTTTCPLAKAPQLLRHISLSRAASLHTLIFIVDLWNFVLYQCTLKILLAVMLYYVLLLCIINKLPWTVLPMKCAISFLQAHIMRVPSDKSVD